MTSATRFSPEVEAVLRSSGWYPGRKVTDEQMRRWVIINWNSSDSMDASYFQLLGYAKIFPAAWRVLLEFGGLTIRSDSRCEPFIVDPYLVEQDGASKYVWTATEWGLGEVLFPLGITRPDYSWGHETALSISTEGRVYRFGVSIQIIGNTIEEALEHLIVGGQSEDIVNKEGVADRNIAAMILDRIEERESQLLAGEKPS